MERIRNIFFVLFVSLIAACSRDIERPNVIIIMGDDYSRGEHSCYGNEVIETPNIDTLIGNSLSFNNFYGSPYGVGTRAQLMSGKHEFRVGVTHDRAPRSYLNLSEKLLPEYFAESGYATAHFGKWQLGSDAYDDEYSARSRGFSHSLVSESYRHNNPTMLQDGEAKEFQGYTTDILFEQAAKWIAAKRRGTPFLCYIAPIAAHAPYVCPEEEQAKYLAKGCSKRQANWYGMISNLDRNIGQLVDYLKASKLYDNTIILYMTDNGHAQGGYNDSMRGGKGSKYRGGSRLPMAIHCPNLPTMATATDELAGAIDLLPTLLDLCDIELDREVEGVTLAPLMRGEVDSLDKRYLVTHAGRWFDGEAENQRLSRGAVQSKRYRLIENRELYDIENDPSEQSNIILSSPREHYDMNLFFDIWWNETRQGMVNEQRAIREGGSRLPIHEKVFREANKRLLINSLDESVDLLSPLRDGTEQVMLIEESPFLATTWESVDPELLPVGSVEREFVEQRGEQIRAKIDSCSKAGVSTFAASDVVILPKRVVEKFGLTAEFGDATNLLIQSFLRSQIAEVFTLFPTLDGLVVRISDEELADAPYHTKSFVERAVAEFSIVPLINLLREEICVKSDKKLIIDQSLLGRNAEESYKAINESVEPHRNLIFALKNCDGASQRHDPFNRLLGEGRHRQIVDVDYSRRYEGGGLYPNYIGAGTISGFEEQMLSTPAPIHSLATFAASKPLIFGGLLVKSGDVLQGELSSSNNFWNRLNWWVLSSWSRTPARSEEAIFNDYAKDELGLKGSDVEKFRRMSMLSAEAVVRGLNTTQGDMDSAWSRSSEICWPDLKGRNILNILRHKDASIMRWEEVVSLSKDIAWRGSATRDFVIGSSYFGLYLYEIYRAVVNLAAAEAEGRMDDIPHWIERYDEAWERFSGLPHKYAGFTMEQVESYRGGVLQSSAEYNVARLR